MDYKHLQEFALKILNSAHQQGIPYKLYWYSPQSRKDNPDNKIGYYETQPSGVTFKHGCKLVITFPRLAFNDLQTTINNHIPTTKQIAYRDNYRSEGDIGFDVYQRVDQLKLFIELGNKASEAFTVEQMLKSGEDWAYLQRKALEECLPALSNQQIEQIMQDVSTKFKRALAYLQAKNPNATLRIRRDSGVRHRMIRVDLAANKTKRLGFSDLVLVFGTTPNLPKVDLPKQPNSNRKPRSDSVSEKYKANPSSFKYYDKFGIFEVYDE